MFRKAHSSAPAVAVESTFHHSFIHAMHGSMKKLQILFPDPLMRKMRRVARQADLLVNEVVRRATELWLERFPDEAPKGSGVPPL
jgi:hypothetical protein